MKSFTNNELPDMTDAYRQMYEGKKKDEDKKDEKKKEPRWQDDDVDGKWYEKSDVDGKISKREKEAQEKKLKKEEVETIDELKSTTLLSYSNKAANELAFKGDGGKKAQKRATGVKRAAGQLTMKAINKEEEVLEGEQLDEISADLALRASKKADIARGKAAHAGDKETAIKKNQQAQRLYAKQAAKRKNESVIKSKKEMVIEDIISRVYENMKGNSPALNQFREDNSLGKIDEGERVAQGAYKRAQELGAKRRRSQGGNRGIGKNERAGYNLSQAASSRNQSAETQGGNQTGGGSKSYGYAKNKSNPVKSKSTGDTSQIGHERKRDEKTSTGKSGKKLKTAKYKLTFKQRMDHHSRKAGSRRDPKQNPKHTDNK